MALSGGIFDAESLLDAESEDEEDLLNGTATDMFSMLWGVGTEPESA